MRKKKQSSELARPIKFVSKDLFCIFIIKSIYINEKEIIFLFTKSLTFQQKSINFLQILIASSKYALLLFPCTRPQESLLSLRGGGPFSSSSSSDPSLDGDGEMALAMRFRLLFQMSSMVLSTPNMCKKLPEIRDPEYMDSKKCLCSGFFQKVSYQSTPWSLPQFCPSSPINRAPYNFSDNISRL